MWKPHFAPCVRLYSLLFLAISLGFWLPGPVRAASVAKVGFQKMSQQSALIFEGRVIATASRGVDTRLPFTEVTFEILDLVKGNVPGATVTLGFLGGSAVGGVLRVADMNIPPVGERGIYFVESTGQRLVHPLYGWDQGRFLVKSDPARRSALVTNAEGAAVLTINRKARPVTTALSDGTAFGVEVTRNGEPTAAISLEQFKQEIRDAIQGH
ncbi:MAG: hypothetical protein KDH88_07315 [Chromatiales bacterium]|nr:hypothetical protein [Chromatiales bacterium]